MKILFIRGNQRHVNDMHINNAMALTEVSEVSFWGPGYVSDDELQKGVKHHWIKSGGYDAVILDFNIAMLHSVCLDIELAYHWNRYFEGNVSIFEMIRYADAIVQDICDLQVPKILFYYLDTYTFREEWLNLFNRLKSKDFYFWMNGEEFCPEIDENTRVHKAMNATNRYRQFCIDNEERIISMSYSSVVKAEFFEGPIVEREYDITVPGNLDALSYPERRLIYDTAHTLNLRVYDSYADRTVEYGNGNSRIMNKEYNNDADKCVDELLSQSCCYIYSKVKSDVLATWKELFSVGICNTKMVYSDGGSAKQLVRKYAEIPIRGALLLCQDIEPLVPYGFVEWENMVTVNDKNLEERCSFLLSHPQEMQRIASQGQKMVVEKHSASVHAKLVIKAIEKIGQGKFAKSKWIRGSFYIQDTMGQLVEV